MFHNGRYDGAVYLCGYAVELILKARICRTLKWSEFPLTRKEFEGLTSFKTHDFEILLRLSGIEEEVKRRNAIEWFAVSRWTPEIRYQPVGSTTAQAARDTIDATATLLKVLK